MLSPAAESKDYTLKHRAQLGLILCVFIYVICIVEYGSYSRTMNNEIADTVNLIGEDNAKRIIDRSHHIFAILERYLPDIEVEDQPIIEREPNRFDDDGDAFSWLNASPYQLWHKTLLLAYQIFFRFSLLLWWGGVMLPLTAAIIWEGYNLRQIKMYEFRSASAVRQNIWLKTSMFMSFMMSMYLILPYASTFGVIYPPLAMLATAIITRNIITHVTKTL